MITTNFKRIYNKTSSLKEYDILTAITVITEFGQDMKIFQLSTTTTTT